MSGYFLFEWSEKSISMEEEFSSYEQVHYILMLGYCKNEDNILKYNLLQLVSAKK